MKSHQKIALYLEAISKWIEKRNTALHYPEPDPATFGIKSEPERFVAAKQRDDAIAKNLKH